MRRTVSGKHKQDAHVSSFIILSVADLEHGSRGVNLPREQFGTGTSGVLHRRVGERVDPFCA